jgi:predicted MFS family arabinose efflux permease
MLKLLQNRADIAAGKDVSRVSTGMRLMVAVAAPVIMLVAPGPMELTQANVRKRLLIFAKAVAMCTEACSFFVW